MQRLCHFRRAALAIITALVLAIAGVAASAAVEPGHRMAGDEGRVSFEIQDQWYPCVHHSVWLSVFLGVYQPLAPGTVPPDGSRAYVIANSVNTCTGAEHGPFEGEVPIEPGQVEIDRLERVIVNDLEVAVTWEGWWRYYTFDLTWTRDGTARTLVDQYPDGWGFQVERYVPASVTGTVIDNGHWAFPGQPWSGEISHLTQVVKPQP